jgi:cytochrome P450
LIKRPPVFTNLCCKLVNDQMATCVSSASRRHKSQAKEGRALTTHHDDIKLTDANFFAKGDIHELFRRMRAADPVHWTQGRLKRSFWSIFKYQEALAVYRGASKCFSNGQFGIGLPSSPEVEATATPESMRANRSLIASDGELHRDFREAFNEIFLPRSIKRYEKSGRKFLHDIIEQVTQRGRCEFVSDVAARLPMALICEMMAIPRQDWPLIFDLVKRAMGQEDPEYHAKSTSVETRRGAWRDVANYCIEAAHRRRDGTGTDLISIIANARVLGGRLLSDEEIGYNGLMFLVGGLDTTSNSIAGGLLELIQNPDQMRRLRNERSLLRSAVEEILRWTSAITHSMRTAVKDTEIRGRKIKAGDWVVVWNASANRDEEIFPDADRFDVGREPNEHLALAHGEHFCLGAHLARLEIRLAFETILDQMVNIELEGEVEWLASNVVHGIKRMPVRFTPLR